ncbi:MAG: sensor histidine kinase KdpD, partial [Verrucomicrobiae bacterium]|nr:sensor histidine kinase KdpD [Verrucomicrobiae bacterium]
MTEPERSDPDALLAALSSEPDRAERGRLKVFLGMCPGVGKTYAMIQAALQRRREGVDVLAGVVETHGRAETAALLQGRLELLSKKKSEYRGVSLEEFDLDAALARRPQLLLVDELAHSNVPGSRHPKRYQDVLELLAAGISVYTTLNVQHLDSRADAVHQIIGAPVRETVPDSLLDGADEIELVDLTPEQLRQRLADGKVYLGERAEAAAAHFFLGENLTALREMALRFMAEHVDRDLRQVMRARNIAGPWKSGERLMVAVGPSPSSESLIRWTRAAAAARDCPWVAVHVEGESDLAESDRRRLTHHLALARQLGAEIVTTSGKPAEAILRVARDRNVTQIVVGKPGLGRLVARLTGGALFYELVENSGDIDICAVRPVAHASASWSQQTHVSRPNQGTTTPGEWGKTAAWVAAATLLGWLLNDVIGYRSVALFYLLAVVGAAFGSGRVPVLLAAITGGILWDFLFVRPLYTFTIGEPQDQMMFFTMIVVGLAFGHVTSKMRQRELAERERERRTAALLEFTNAAALSPEMDEGMRSALDKLNQLFKARTALLLRDHQTRKLGRAAHAASTYSPDPKEVAVASYAFEKRTAAGRFTDSLPDSPTLWLPLLGRTAAMGALGVWIPPERSLSLGERDWLDNFALQVATILEKEHFIQAFQRAEVLSASERLRQTLLDSVSHELKTPLAALQAAADGLEQSGGASEDYLRELRQALSRLHRLVNNLLNMTRLESGAVQTRRDWCDLGELCDAAIEFSADVLSRHPVRRDLPNDLPLVKLDQALIEQALANLLINAGTHTPDGAEVDLRARVQSGSLVLEVLDRGPGLPEGESESLFQKFVRGPNAATGGSGLGLAISRGFVRACGGDVTAANRSGGGAAFTIRLPVEIHAGS